MRTETAFEGMRCPRCGKNDMGITCDDTDWVSNDTVVVVGMMECYECGWSALYSQTLHTVTEGIEIHDEEEDE